jgi:hypothetical protein
MADDSRFAVFCTCGAALTGSISPRGAADMARLFHLAHTGDGHRLCDRATAAAARRRNEAAVRRNEAMQ